MPTSNGTANGTQTRLRAARPTIAVAGQENAALAAGLVRLLVAETTSGLYRCEATFGNWGEKDRAIGFLHFDRQTLDFGKSLQVKVGSGSTAASLFDGRIVGIEAVFPRQRSPEITVLAEDRFQDLRMTRRTRSFEDISDRDLFQRIASDHGLTADVDVSGLAHRVLAQVNQSDLAFLRERARAVDAEVWVDDRTLRAAGRAKRATGPAKLVYGRELHEFVVLADLAHQRTGVSVAGWDVAGKEALRHEATDSALGGELNGDLSGASILDAAFGARKDAVVHTVPLTRQETQAMAEAVFRTGARRFVTGRGTADVEIGLRVGRTVELSGLGPLFNGAYYVSEVRHLFDVAAGIRSEFTAERPGLGRPR